METRNSAMAHELNILDLPIGVYVVAPGGQFIACNRPVRAMFNLPLEGDVHASIGQFYADPKTCGELLRWLLTQDSAIRPAEPPEWIKPHQVAVFTVESKGEIQQHLNELGITVFRQKPAGLRDTILLVLIDELLVQAVEVER